MINTFTVNESYAVVGAHEDIDGAIRKITVLSSRVGNDDAAKLEMTPRVARQLARQLNKWAKLIDPPKARRR